MTALPHRGRTADESAATKQLARLRPPWRWKQARSRASSPRRVFTPLLPGGEAIRVDEYRDGTAQLIRADLPGLNPAEDIEIW